MQIWSISVFLKKKKQQKFSTIILYIINLRLESQTRTNANHIWKELQEIQQSTSWHSNGKSEYLLAYLWSYATSVSKQRLMPELHQLQQQTHLLLKIHLPRIRPRRFQLRALPAAPPGASATGAERRPWDARGARHWMQHRNDIVTTQKCRERTCIAKITCSSWAPRKFQVFSRY